MRICLHARARLGARARRTCQRYSPGMVREVARARDLSVPAPRAGGAGRTWTRTRMASWPPGRDRLTTQVTQQAHARATGTHWQLLARASTRARAPTHTHTHTLWNNPVARKRKRARTRARPDQAIAASRHGTHPDGMQPGPKAGLPAGSAACRSGPLLSHVSSRRTFRRRLTRT